MVALNVHEQETADAHSEWVMRGERKCGRASGDAKGMDKANAPRLTVWRGQVQELHRDGGPINYGPEVEAPLYM